MGHDELGRSAPDPAVPDGFAHTLPLRVSKVVDDNAGHADGKQRGGEGQSEVIGVIHEVEGGRRVEPGYPHETTPNDVETRPVVRHVRSAEVAPLPPKELGDINELEAGRDGHAVAQPVKVLLFRREGHGDQCPAHQTEAAGDQPLDVPSENPRKELRSPIVVKNRIAAGSRVAARGRQASLHVKEGAKEQAENVEGTEKPREVIVDDRRRNHSKGVGGDEKQRHGNEKAGESVVPIGGHVAVWSRRTLKGLARYDSVEKELCPGEHGEDRPGLRRTEYHRPPDCIDGREHAFAAKHF